MERTCSKWYAVLSVERWCGYAAYLSYERIDYDKLCHILLRELKSPNNRLKIVNLGIGGGIGHKFRSLILSLTNALMLKRNYLRPCIQ